MADPNACLAAADAAAAGRLDDDEIALIAEEMRRTRAAAEGLDALDRAMFDAAEQLAEEGRDAALIEKRNRLINAVAAGKLRSLARAAKDATGDASLGLESVMVGVNAPFAGSRASVDAKANGILRMHLGGMVADLRRAGLIAKFNSGHLSREIARELWDLSLKRPTGKATDSADAKGIAAILDKYRRAAVERENRAGAAIRYRSGWVTRQSHDARKLRREGFAAWADTVRGRMDWAAMKIAPQGREAFLREAYDALASGVRLTAMAEDESGLAFAFKGPGNLAKKESASRVLLFRSADDWFDYNERFGRANLNESVMGDLRRSAMATALMDAFGTNPRALFDRLRQELKEKHRGEPEQVDRLNRLSLDWQFAEIDGSVNMEGSHTLAVVGRTVRAIQTMAKLGGAVLSSVTDIANVASERRYQGRSIAESWMDGFRAPFEGLATAGEKRRLAELLGVGIDGVLGDFVSRFSAQDDAPGRVSKAMGLFFRLNLLGQWTDAAKRGVGLMMARDLAMAADGGDWASIGDDMRRNLGTYGVTEADWPRVRAAVLDGPDGRRYLDPSAIRAEGDGPAARRERDRLSAALATYIADRVDFASPTAGARERALLRLGLRAGTVAGEAVRFMTQFKSFPVTVMTKTLGRDLYGRGARTMRDALIRGEGDRLGLASYIAGATVLGLFALQAKEIAKGREPRELNAETLTAAMLQSGGWGIYGDFLFGEANRFGGGPLETLAGPAIGEAANAIEIIQRLRAATFRGEAPDVGAEVLRFVRGNTPFINLFYTKVALDYLIFYELQEMANPGYLRRMERRMKRENDQEFFFPPSEVVR